MSPERPIMSASKALASDNILSEVTITPRSMISYPLQPKTTPTIFFPMSCTSPLTVAKIIFPLDLSTKPISFFSCSI